VVTMGISAILYFKNTMTIGSIFFMYQIAKMLQNPLNRCFEIIIHKSINTVHIERIDEFEKSLLKENEFNKLYSKQDKLVDIPSGTFYTNSDKDQKLFSADNVEIFKNSLTLIKGSNGTGKSMFINYLCGFSEVRSFDGTINLDNSLQKAAYLTYPILLVDGNLEENLFEKKAKQDVYEMLSISFGDKIIDSKTENLSFGEQQKLNLLRVLSEDTDTFVLDEPFSNLDKKTIERLAKYISCMKKNKNIIAIVHSNELDKYADRIYEIANNKMIRVV